MVTLNFSRDHRSGGGGSHRREGVWSGDTTRGIDYNLTESQVTIELEGQSRVQQVQQQLAKERPIWMVESTVEGASNDSTSMVSKIGIILVFVHVLLCTRQKFTFLQPCTNFVHFFVSLK